MANARRLQTICLVGLCHDEFEGTHEKMKFVAAGVDSGVSLDRVEERRDEKTEESLGGRVENCGFHNLCYSDMIVSPPASEKFPIRCCIRLLGINVLSERLGRKFYGTRPQSAPSPFYTPLPRP